MDGVLGIGAMIARTAAVVAGVWLMFSPAVFGYGSPAAINDRIFGPIGASLAFVAIWEIVRPLRWATIPIGSWLVIAPLVLGYDDGGAIASSIGAGAVMVGAAFGGGTTEESFGGGWTTLLPGHDVPPATARHSGGGGT